MQLTNVLENIELMRNKYEQEEREHVKKRVSEMDSRRKEKCRVIRRKVHREARG